MKVLRTAGMVVAAVALVATGVGIAAGGAAAAAAGSATAATAMSIGTYASLATGVLSMAAAFMAPKMGVEGSATTFTTNPQSGLPYAIGRTRMSGLRVYARTYDGFKQQSKHDILAFVAMLSIAGPIHSIEQFTADNEVVTFETSTSVGDAIGRFNRYMAQRLSLGASSGPALDMSFGGKFFPDWTANHKLSGIAHAQWALRFDTDGDLYGAGAPEPAWIGKWVKVYDPRKDSTYPGGSGSHRALNEATYEWSDNPGLHALTWALGRWQNGKRVCGIGAPVSTIRVADFVECANVCDANGWKVGGVEWTTDSKWDTLKRILQAGGAVPTQTGAMIGCLTSTPRTAVATIESRHLLDGLSIAATKSRRDRFNSVIPRYVDEDSDWAVISGTAITVADYVTADGGQRTKEVDFPLVQVFSGETANQPGQLAAYAVVNSREAGPFTWTTGPEWIGLKTGDVVYLNVPEEGLVNQPVLITRRAPDPATGKVSFAGETETYSKHAYALGQSTTPPAPFRLEAPDLKPAAPIAANWNATGTVTGEGLPAIIVTGASEMPSADAVLIDYRKAMEEEWTRSAILSAVEPVQHVIAPLESETSYHVRVGYRVGTIDGSYTILPAVTTGVGVLTDLSESVTSHDEQLAQLDADIVAAETAIAAAQLTITNMQADAAAVQVQLEQAQADILAAQTDILANSSDLATVETTLASHGASITTLQTTASTHTDQLATINSTLTTQGASITSNSTAISTLQGNVASINTTLTSHGSSISTLQSASSTQAGQIASLQTQVTAGNPNLCPNGGFENGLAGWTGSAFALTSNGWGKQAATTSNGTSVLASSLFPVFPGINYTASADWAFFATGGQVYLDMLFYDDSLNLLLDGGQSACNPTSDFHSDGAGRNAIKTTSQAPAGATKAQVRFVVQSGTGVTFAGVRQIKVESGTVATAYSAEASVGQSFTAITTANSNIATLQSTVATQGATISSNSTAITTLQGQTAALTTRVAAGSQNLLPNGSFEAGFQKWNNTSGWGTGVLNGWGSYAHVTSAGFYILDSDLIACGQGASYTIAADIACFGGAGSYGYVDILYFGADGTTMLLDGGQNSVVPTRDFTSDTSRRAEVAHTSIAPAGAYFMKVRCIANAVGSPYIGFRQIKLEKGTTWSPYSSEASIVQTFSSLSTLTSQYASLSSTVSTQGVTITSNSTAITTLNGNVTTLFGRAAVTVDVNGRMTGWEINNNGTVGDFTIRSDRFRVLPPSGTTDGFYIDIDGSGRTTQYIKSGSVRVVELGWLS